MNSNCKITQVADTVFKIVRYNDGFEKERDSLMVTNLTPAVSNSGICKCEQNSATGCLEFHKNGKAVISEISMGYTQSFRIGEDDAVYGLGMHQSKPMNRRNSIIRMAQGNFWFFSVCAPFITTTGGYAILLDNYSFMSIGVDKHSWGDNFTEDTDCDSVKANMINISAADNDNFVYYIILEEEIDDQIKAYRKLNGKAPMYPKWAYGYFQCREHYKTQDEILDIATTFRDKRIPIDCIVQDWNYWGGHGWNALRWDSSRYPDPKAMIDKLHNMNMSVMISVWPTFGANTEVARELEAANAVLAKPNRAGEEKYGRVHDPLNPAAEAIVWGDMKSQLFDKGIDAWWLDATEPVYETDSSLHLLDCNPCALGDNKNYLNCYGFNVSKNVYNNQRKATDGKRVFILTRSGYAGQQKYAAASWTGDIFSNWEVFKRQIPAILSYSLSGIPYAMADIGGFICEYPGGNQNEEFRELYTRWFWFGAFSSIFRSHGTVTPREPWFFGDPGTPFYDSIMTALKLRYKFLPYIYALAHKVYAQDYTMIRPLAMDFRSDRNVWDITDGYMFGDSLLVYAVTEYMARQKDIYLPGGSKWYDYFTRQRYDGGQHITVDTPISMTPLFVRAGSIILTGPDVQHTGQDDCSIIDVNIYTGADCSAYYYQDEGDNYNYESGKYIKIQFDWDDAANTLTIHDVEGKSDVFSSDKTMRIYINGNQADALEYSGKEVRGIFYAKKDASPD